MPGQPVGQGQPVTRPGREGANLLDGLTGSIAEADTDDDVVLVNIEAGTAGGEGIQEILRIPRPGDSEKQTVCSACSLRGSGDKLGFVTLSGSDSNAGWEQQALQKRPPPKRGVRSA